MKLSEFPDRLWRRHYVPPGAKDGQPNVVMEISLTPEGWDTLKTDMKSAASLQSRSVNVFEALNARLFVQVVPADGGASTGAGAGAAPALAHLTIDCAELTRLAERLSECQAPHDDSVTFYVVRKWIPSSERLSRLRGESKRSAKLRFVVYFVRADGMVDVCTSTAFSMHTQQSLPKILLQSACPGTRPPPLSWDDMRKLARQVYVRERLAVAQLRRTTKLAVRARALEPGLELSSDSDSDSELDADADEAADARAASAITDLIADAARWRNDVKKAARRLHQARKAVLDVEAMARAAAVCMAPQGPRTVFKATHFSFAEYVARQLGCELRSALSRLPMDACASFTAKLSLAPVPALPDVVKRNCV